MTRIISRYRPDLAPSSPAPLPADDTSWHGNPPVTSDHSGGHPARAKPRGEPPIPQNRWTWLCGASVAASRSRTSATSTRPAGNRPSATRSASTTPHAGSMSV